MTIYIILCSACFRVTSYITPFQFQKVQPQQSMWSNAQLRRAAHVQAIPQTEILILITRPDIILCLWLFQPYLLELQGLKTVSKKRPASIYYGILFICLNEQKLTFGWYLYFSRVNIRFRGGNMPFYLSDSFKNDNCKT